MARKVSEYLDAIQGFVNNMANDVGIGGKPKAQDLVKAYQAYAKAMNGNPDAKKFADWMADEKLGKAELLKIEAGQQADAEAAARAYMENQEKSSAIFQEVYAGGKLAVEQSGNFLSRNWPLLAAVAAPLLLGNFFELGTLPLVGIALAGLAAATYAAGEDSLLGGVKSFIYKQFNLGEPFKKEGPAGPALDPNKAPVGPPAPMQLMDLTTGQAVKDATVTAVMAPAGQMTVNGKPENVALVGTRNGATVVFDEMVILGKDGKPQSAPVDISSTSLAAVRTMQVDASNRVPALSAELTTAIAPKLSSFVKLPDPTPAASTMLNVVTDGVVYESTKDEERKVVALVRQDNTGKTTLTGFAMANENGTPSETVRITVTPPVNVTVVGGKLMNADGTQFDIGSATNDLQAKAGQDAAPAAPVVPTPKPAAPAAVTPVSLAMDKPLTVAAGVDKKVDLVGTLKSGTATDGTAEITSYVLKDTGVKVEAKPPIMVKMTAGKVTLPDGKEVTLAPSIVTALTEGFTKEEAAKKPAAVPAAVTSVPTDSTILDKEGNDIAMVALVSENAGKTKLTGFATLKPDGKPSVSITINPPVEVTVQDGKILTADGSEYNISEANTKLQKKYEDAEKFQEATDKFLKNPIGGIKDAAVGIGAAYNDPNTMLGKLGVGMKKAAAQADFTTGNVTVSAPGSTDEVLLGDATMSYAPQPVTIAVASKSDPETVRTFKGTMSSDGVLRIDTLVVPDDKGGTKDIPLKDKSVTISEAVVVTKNELTGEIMGKLDESKLKDAAVMNPLTDLVKEIGADGQPSTTRDKLSIPTKATTTAMVK